MQEINTIDQLGQELSQLSKAIRGKGGYPEVDEAYKLKYKEWCNAIDTDIANRRNYLIENNAIPESDEYIAELSEKVSSIRLQIDQDADEALAKKYKSLVKEYDLLANLFYEKKVTTGNSYQAGVYNRVRDIAYMFGGNSALVLYLVEFYRNTIVVWMSDDVEAALQQIENEHIQKYTGIERAFAYRMFADYWANDISKAALREALRQKAIKLLEGYNIGYYEYISERGNHTWGIDTGKIFYPGAKNIQLSQTDALNYPESKERNYPGATNRRRILVVNYLLELARANSIDKTNKARLIHFLTNIDVPEAGISNSGIYTTVKKGLPSNDNAIAIERAFIVDFLRNIGLEEAAKLAENDMR